jgi:prephenate dehydratase
VDKGVVGEGIVPIENSIEGSVTDTLDLLIHEVNLLLKTELVLSIEHHLLSQKEVNLSDIQMIFSHPQVISQCRKFLERSLPQARVIPALSTAAAVEQMMSYPEEKVGAIGTHRAANLYGAHTLVHCIQDYPQNLTRFVVVAKEDHPRTGNDKTSLCLSFSEDRPGLLYEVFQEFAQKNINLTKIESRPSKESLGRYFFLVDLEGHREEKVIAQVLKKVELKSSQFKILGSYPRFTPSS